MTYEQQQDINIVIVGSPETVTRKLTETITKLNPGYLHIYGNEGAMPHKDVMRSIELMGKEVIPAPPRDQAGTLRVGGAAQRDAPLPTGNEGGSSWRSNLTMST